MKLRHKALIGVVIVFGVGVVAMQSHEMNKPDPALCEHVLRQAYAKGATLANRPPECDGIRQAELEAMIGRILTEQPPPGTNQLTSY